MSKSKRKLSRQRSSGALSKSSITRILEQAEDLIQAGKPDDAVQLLRPLAKRANRDADVQYQLGYALVKAGDLWEGVSYYQKALELSQDPGLWIPLGYLHLDLDLRMLGLRALRRAIRHNPTHPLLEEVRHILPHIEAEVQEVANHLGISAPLTEDGLALMDAGQVALKNGSYSQCITLNRKSIRLLNTFPPPHNNLSLALFFHGQPQEAIQTARQVLQHHPGNIQAMANLVRFLAWGGEETEARKVWDVLKQQPLHLDDLRMKALEAAAVIGDDQMVLSLAQQLITDDWDDQGWIRMVLYFKAIAEANQGMPSASRSLKQLKGEGRLVDAVLEALKNGQTGLGWAQRFPYFDVGELMPGPEFGAFVDLLKRQDKMPPQRFRKEVGHFVERFPQLVLIGKRIILEDQQDEPGIQFLKVIGTSAAYAVLREFGLGQLGSDEARRRAMFALLEAEQIQPGETVRMWQNGQWQDVQLHRYEVTDDSYRDYLPRAVELLNRALKLYQKNNLDEAERVFLNVLRLEPRAKEAYNNLGTIYAQRGEHKQAKVMFEQAVAVDPLYVMARCNLAIYLLDDDVTAAEAMMTPLIDIEQMDLQALVFSSYVRARIAVEKDQFDEARSQLDLALEMNPDYQPARDLLDHLTMVQTWQKGYATWQERLERDRRAARSRLQNRLGMASPALAEAMGIYTKDALTGMGRVILPMGGWSTLKKAELHQYLVDNLQDTPVLKRLVIGLSPHECQGLRHVLEHGGYLAWQEFDDAYGNDLEESPYWIYHEPKSLMGRLRIRGLLVEARVDEELIVTVPLELRDPLQNLLVEIGA